MADEILDRLVKAIEKLSSNGDQLPKPQKLTMYDDYDLWEDRMKLYLESVSEGNRSLAILGQLDSDVYAVARAANITSSLTTATIFERLRREFGRSPMPWVARATLRERRQHSGESVVDFQRHLRVLAKQAYPDDSCSALEDRILDNFVDGIANLDIRRKFMLDPPKTLKAALDSARDEEVIYAALSPSPGPSSSVPSGPRFQTAPPQSQMVNVFAMGPRPTCDIGTQTARWQWDPQPQSTPRYDHQRSTPRRGNWRDQRGRWTRPQYRPGVHTITAGEEEESGNPVLTFPDISDQAGIFVLDTDASETAIGAVLSQRQADGTERVIQYLSRSLTKAERRYCVTRKEMLALTFFIEECRPFLQYRKFLVRTDHSSLAWLRNFKNAEGQVARWQERLAGFEFDCNHRPGRQHNNADALSRKPYRPHGECPSCTDTSINNITLHEDQSSLWAQAQRDDPHIGPIYYRKLGESRPLSGPELRGLSYETRCLHTVWDKLFLDNEVLFYRDGDQYPRRIVLPLSMTDDVLTRIHTQLGHVGIHKTEWDVRRRYYWPNLRRYVWDFIRYCTLCNQLKPPPHLNRAHLQPILTGYPNELVGVDIIGPIAPSVRGNRYILVMVDFFTKMAEVEPLPNMSADTVAQAIFNGWVCRWGAPDQIHSDRGTSFENAVLHSLCKYLRINKTRTTAYHPQGNGQVERTNRTLIGLLKAFVDRQAPFTWDDALPACMLAYRSTIHSSTQQSPFALTCGREMRIPEDLQVPLENNQVPVNSYVTRLHNKLRIAAEEARTHLHGSQNRQKDHYDKLAHGCPYVVGDIVWLREHTAPQGIPSKFVLDWSGPYTVTKVISDTTCVIQDRERPFATEITVHFNRLKLGERPDAYGPEDQGNIVCDVDRDQVGRIVEIPPEGGDEFEVPFSDRRHNLEDNRSMLHDTSQNEGTAIAEDSDVSMEEGVM
ncbi:hypothetical protein SprV_0401411300 [Sparganum proliferum]